MRRLMPPAALVASITVSAPSSPRTRSTGAETPVEVSLCGQAYTSTPSTGLGVVREPGSALRTSGACSHGAAAAAANLPPNSPKTRFCARFSMRPNDAASQNAVDPPLPTMIS